MIAPAAESLPGVFLRIICPQNRLSRHALNWQNTVELPGIEPGSYGIPSRLLRAQFAMPLLGSPVHAN
jgi:hypothetical protein